MKVRSFVCNSGCAGGRCFIAVDTDTGRWPGPPGQCVWGGLPAGEPAGWNEAMAVAVETPVYYACRTVCVHPCVLVVERAATGGSEPHRCPWMGSAEWEREMV